MWNSVQEGQAGPEAYHETTRQTQTSADQSIGLLPSLVLRLDGGWQQQFYSGNVGATNTDLNQRTAQGGLALDLGVRQGRFSLYGDGFDQASSGNSAQLLHLNRDEIGATMNLNPGFVRLNGQGLFTTARQQNLSGPDSRTQELDSSIDARTRLPRLGELSYRFSGLADRNLTLEQRTTQITNGVTFLSNTRFAGGRGSADLKLDSNFFNETDKQETNAAGARLRLPVSGGYRLDDTPEQADPLEGDVIPVPALYDRNRLVATEIDLGDSAPVVHEFGGDYRNIQYDFGEAVDLVSATLYVDRTLLTSAFFGFRVFYSNDPQGRLWTEVPSAGFRAVYQEWGTGLQGWTVTLASRISSRFFKIVDVKLGPTVPDLYVTEFEVDTEQAETSAVDRSSTQDQRVSASVGYQLIPSVHVGYDFNLDHRSLSGQNETLNDVDHGVSAGWSRNLWSLSGRGEFRNMAGELAGRIVDNNQSVTLQRGKSSTLTSDLSWSRDYEAGNGMKKTSNDLSLGAAWPAAPALQLQERASVGGWPTGR